MSAKVRAPENASITRDAPYAGKFGMMGDAEALPNQPGWFDFGICCHKGTKDHPAYQGMLDAEKVAGLYQSPDCSCCTSYVRPVPALGFLCVCDCIKGCPVCCYIVPFNCCGWTATCGTGGLGPGGPTIDLFYCPVGKCLPKTCTLAATWFCLPGYCMDFKDNDTLLTSCCCCVYPQVHRKIKQLDIICQRPKSGCCAEYDIEKEGCCPC